MLVNVCRVCKSTHLCRICHGMKSLSRYAGFVKVGRVLSKYSVFVKV